MMLFLRFVFFLFLFLFSSYVLAATSKNIKIVGNDNIDDEVIFSIINDKITDYSSENINQIIKHLYSSGNFKNIEIEYSDNDILLKITENPTINKLIFVGNKRLKDEEILEMFNQDEFFRIFNQYKIDKFIEYLSEVYLSYGYNLINIEFEQGKNQLDDNFVDLKFKITEGKISKINKILFIGNKIYSTNKLRSIVKSKQKNLLRFFDSVNFKNFQIRRDQERLINFYKKNGYKDININYQTEFIKNKNRFNIYFYIEEGNIYQFENINLNLDSLTLENNYKEELINLNKTYYEKNLSKDITYNIEKLTNLQDILIQYLYNIGLVFFDVKILEKINNFKVDIIFEFIDISPQYVNEINITGNTRTKDKVIRREIPFAEGDSINNELVRKTQRNISKLQFFKSINIKETINNDLVDVDIDVEEAPTGQFNFGVAFDSYRGATFISGLQENNIAGDGRNIDLSINTSENNRVLSFGIVEPYIFNQNLDFIYDVTYSEDNRSDSASYKLNEFNSSIGLRYLLADKLKHSISLEYQLKDYTITNSSTVSSIIEKQSGSNSDIILNNSLVYDDLDALIRPTKGNHVAYFNKLSPATNNENGYVKNIVTYKKYFKQKSNVLSMQSRIGNIFSLQNEEIPTDDKFSLGGRWLRGFDNFGVGPRNSRTSYTGGNNLVVTKLDFQRPILSESDNPVDLNLFIDAGTVFGNKVTPTSSGSSIRSSFGYGIKFYSPIGPVGFSWAYPITDEDYDIKRMFNFSIGNLN